MALVFHSSSFRARDKKTQRLEEAKERQGERPRQGRSRRRFTVVGGRVKEMIQDIDDDWDGRKDNQNIQRFQVP